MVFEMTIIWQMLFLQGLGCLLQSAPRRAGILGAEDSSSLTDNPHHLPSALCSEHQSARCQSEQPWGAALQLPSWQRYPRGREQGCVCGTSSAALGANLARWGWGWAPWLLEQPCRLLQRFPRLFYQVVRGAVCVSTWHLPPGAAVTSLGGAAGPSRWRGS